MVFIRILVGFRKKTPTTDHIIAGDNMIRSAHRTTQSSGRGSPPASNDQRETLPGALEQLFHHHAILVGQLPFDPLTLSISVTLTAVSGFIALATMPILFATVVPAALGVEAFGVPVAGMTTHLLLFLVLPAGLGMILRRLFPALLERAGPAIRAFGLAFLLVFLALQEFLRIAATLRKPGESLGSELDSGFCVMHYV